MNPKGDKKEEDNFRDQIATVDKSGNRIWVYPKQPKGRYYNWRTLVNAVLLTLLFTGPFLRINGEPVLLLDVVHRRFIIFGQIFWPQDFYIFGLATVAFMLFIVLFTVVYGRVFCGWICPQTIFMEGVFRKVEYWIEGDWTAQKKLDRQKWDSEKYLKKGAKHLVFLFISFLIANTFLAYLIGSETLIGIVTEPPQEHLKGLMSILIFTGAFYYVFAFFREQVCTTVCPYGRLQGVLLDRKSMVVAYDHERGELRAKLHKGEDRAENAKGDCIDCKLCVNVCPTGIDIRNGTQMECVNCTACMDACDSIMDNIGLARGLIRIDSEDNIAEGKIGFRWTTRNMAYTAVMLLLTGLLTSLLVMRSDVDATLLRTPGVMYQTRDNGDISNLYNIKVINKTNQPLDLRLKLESSEGQIELVGGPGILQLPAQGTTEGALFLVLDTTHISGISQQVRVGIYSDGKLLKTVGTKFIGPGR